MKNNLFISLLYNGLTEDSNLNERSRAAVLNSISILGITILTIFTIVDIINKKFGIAILTGSTVILILIAIILVGLIKKLIIGTTMVTYIAFVLFSILLLYAGEDRAGYFWMNLVPLIAIFFLGLTHGTIITIIFGITSYILIFKFNYCTYKTFNPEMGLRALGVYWGVTTFTIAFELVRIKAFNQLEKTTADLVEKRRQTSMILHNVKQGIFLLNENLELSNERSTYFNELFGTNNKSNYFVDLIKDKLPKRDFSATRDYLELFFNKTVNPTLLSSINPIEKILMSFTESNGTVNQLWLEFEFERILLKNGEIQILGLFKDVTERVLLEEQLLTEENENLQNMETLFQIIHINPELMAEFLNDTNDEISKINDLLRVETTNIDNVINNIFTSVHSIKGNSLLLGLKSIAIKLNDFEDYIKELQITTPTWRELLKLTVNLSELKHDINGMNDLIEKIVSFQQKSGGGIQNKRYIFEESLKKSVKKLSTEYNKDIDLDLSSYNYNIIPNKYKRLLKDSINQFIRNSIAHGIESKEQRIKYNKPPKGIITISISKKQNYLEFIYRDDGCGLSIKNIKKAAIEKKGFTAQQIKEMSSADAVKLIFHPGISTADKVDSLAGQGIGMSVVKTHVEQVGGKLNIKSSSGKFCEFRILLKL